MKARTFRRTLATVKKPAEAVLGVTSVGMNMIGREVGLIAPDTARLAEAWAICFPAAPKLDRKRVQRVVYFRQRSLTSRKRMPKAKR